VSSPGRAASRPHLTSLAGALQFHLAAPGLALATALLALTAALLLVGCGGPGEAPEPFEPAPILFTDVTQEAGLVFRRGAPSGAQPDDGPVHPESLEESLAEGLSGGGLCWLDHDNDGWLDLFAVRSYPEASQPHSALFHNRAGAFTDVTVQAGASLAQPGTGCLAADFNLDGWTDLYVTTARANVLLWNRGDGTFEEGAREAGVDAFGWHTGAAAGDLNGDGWPDLFVAGYVDLNRPIPGTDRDLPYSHHARQDLLYVNQGLDPSGRVTFREAGPGAGLEAGQNEYGLGALLSDLDQDGDLDLLVANDGGPDRLYENVPWPGGASADTAGLGFRLAEAGAYAQIAARFGSSGLAVGDYDGDGRLDLLFARADGPNPGLYRRTSDDGQLLFEAAALEAAALEAGLSGLAPARGASWADLDLDTDLDLVLAKGGGAGDQPIQTFTNLTAQGAPGRFRSASRDGSTGAASGQPGRAVALADFDNDGDLDALVWGAGGELRLLRNDTPGGNWLMVDLRPLRPGATVTALLPGGRQLLCETRAGSSTFSSEDPRCHFGLGSARLVRQLAVRWPDGTSRELRNVEAGQIVSVAKPETSPPGPAWLPDPAEAEAFLFELSLKRGGARSMTVVRPAPDELVRLGEALFWDRELSGNRDIACVTCHHPAAATGDALSLSVGTGGSGLAAERRPGLGRTLVPRNATELFNRGAEGWHTFFWDGRITWTAEEGLQTPAGQWLPESVANIMAAQALFPVTSRDEMRGLAGDLDVFGRPNELAGLDDDDWPGIWQGLMDRLLAIPGYRELFGAAYPGPALEALDFGHAANALAAYQMSVFTFTDSPWDRYLAGDRAALSGPARRGAALFYGGAGCSRCHNGSLLTDQQFHNLAVPQLGPGKGEGAPHDYGRGQVSGAGYDNYAFRTPPLRNVALTGPWMHNGAYTSLEAAVRHHLNPAPALRGYNPGQLDPLVRATYRPDTGVLAGLDPLLQEASVALTHEQLADLLAFLASLTSPSALEGCRLAPDRVPSGLPIDRGGC
jgi:cytochrome c peroxidase